MHQAWHLEYHPGPATVLFHLLTASPHGNTHQHPSWHLCGKWWYPPMSYWLRQSTNNPLSTANIAHIMCHPLCDQYHFWFSHLFHQNYRHHLLSILSWFPNPSKPQNATPDDLTVCCINHVHSPKASSCNNELLESKWIVGEAGQVGEHSGRDGWWIGPCYEPDCKAEEVPSEVLPFFVTISITYTLPKPVATMMSCQNPNGLQARLVELVSTAGRMVDG